MPDEQELKRSFITLLVICISIIVTTFVYAYVVDFIEEQNAPFAGFVRDFGDVQTLRYSLLGVTIAIFFVIRPLKRFLLSERFASMSGRTGGPASVPYSQYISAYVIVYALCEAICIFGLVMFLIDGNKIDFYTFMPLALVAMGYNFPKYAKMREWAMKMAGEAPPADSAERGVKDYRRQ